MNRFLACAGAFAFAAVQPAVSLAAHPAAWAVPHPVAPAAPAPRPIAPGAPVNQPDVKVPFHVNMEPIHLNVPTVHESVQPLRIAPQPFMVRPAAFRPQAMVSPYRWYRWQPMPTYLWYPGSAWNGPACLSNNSAVNPPNEFSSTDFTLGSLVDGKANLLSPQSYNNYAADTSLAATSPSPVAFQVGFYPSACGAPGFTNF